MKQIKIKVIVDKDVTACLQLRTKPKDSEWSDHVCGCDIVGHLVVANSPKVYGATFLDLIKEVILVKHYMAPRYFVSEFEALDNIEYVRLSDDSQALVRLPDLDEDTDDYYQELFRVQKEQREKLAKYKDNMLRNLVLNTETGDYEGEIEIYV